MSVIGYWIDDIYWFAADGWGSTEQFRTYTAPAPFNITDKTAAVYIFIYMYAPGWMECGRGRMGKAVGIYSLSCRSLFCLFGESGSNKCTMVLEGQGS